MNNLKTYENKLVEQLDIEVDTIQEKEMVIRDLKLQISFHEGYMAGLQKAKELYDESKEVE